MTISEMKRHRKQSGSALITVAFMVLFLSIGASLLYSTSQGSLRKQQTRIARTQAFYHAENALLEGIQRVADENSSDFIDSYNKSELANMMPYSLSNDEDTYYDFDLNMKIERDTSANQGNIYIVTAQADVQGKSRILRARVEKNPPSHIFDYEYFLNNWGWWWGSSITGYGDQRTNWDFDVRYNPTVNGHLHAFNNIEENTTPVDVFSGSIPFRGTAASDPDYYVHIGEDHLVMPNLDNDFDHYASDADGTLVQGGSTLIDGTHSDSTNERGIYLYGTDSNPIEIDGRVVVYGDVIIHGKVTGQGTLYVGGNLYVAGDLTYDDGPDFTENPGSMTLTDQESWVDDSINKDLIAFAVRESILAGQVTKYTAYSNGNPTSTWTDWYRYPYNNSSYGLKSRGDESQLGADGIPDTPDDGVDYLDTDDDGSPDSAWYDADGDGVVDRDYNFETDFEMNAPRAAKIDGYPTYADGNLKNYYHVATNQFNDIEGIFYTNHAFGYKSNKSGRDKIHGAIICRDEAWVFSSGQDIRYDPRVHSRYHSKYFDGNGNLIIDLGLPIIKLDVLRRYEDYDAQHAAVSF